MHVHMSIIEARKRFTNLPEALHNQTESSVIAVTKRGHPVLAVMSWDSYASLMETLEIMGDEKLIFHLKNGLQQAASGQTVSWRSIKKQLNRY